MLKIDNNLSNIIRNISVGTNLKSKNKKITILQNKNVTEPDRPRHLTSQWSSRRSRLPPLSCYPIGSLGWDEERTGGTVSRSDPPLRLTPPLFSSLWKKVESYKNKTVWVSLLVLNRWKQQLDLKTYKKRGFIYLKLII